MKKFNKMLSVVLSLILCASLVAPALAVTYDISAGNVTVTETGSSGYVFVKGDADADPVASHFTSTDKEITIEQSGEGSTDNTIKVGDNVTDTVITLDNVNITGTTNVESSALSIGRDSNVTVNLVGGNTLEGYGGHAGLELNGGSVTIVGTGTEEGDASLTANGNDGGAGIGGGDGNITIKNSIVTAQGSAGAEGGAGIGGGKNAMAGNITIEDSKVTSTAGAVGSGIGAGSGGMTGDISITNSEVFAQAGWSKDGIGLGGNNGDITIEGGKVTGQAGKNGIAVEGEDSTIKITDATVEAYATVSGDGLKGTKEIIIDGSDVTANSVAGGAAIGSAHGVTGRVEIKNGSTVKATSNEVAIGGGGYGNFAGEIIIDNSKVTAISKGEAAIGAGGGKMSGNITIANGAVVTAVGGNKSAIGRDEGAMTGEISISNDSTVLALNRGTDPAVLKNSGENSILNGQFDTGYFNNSVQSGKTKFTIVDKDGNELAEFDVKVTEKIAKNIYDPAEAYEETFQSFGIIWPEGAFAIKDADGNYVGFMDGEDKVVAYKFMDTAKLLTQGGLQAVTNTVKYVFAGENLPSEVTDQLTEDVNAETTFGPVRVAGGRWVFRSWAPDKAEISEDGKLQDVTYTGTWGFETNDGGAGDTSGTTTIEDDAIPLAGLFTRADAIGYLWQQAGEPEAELSDFEDVPEDHEWAVAIGWAQDMGIALADEEGNFRPDDLVLRSTEDIEGELQEFLNRYAVYAGIELDEGELFIELAGAPDDVIMGEDAQAIFDDFFAKLEAALSQAA